MTERAAFAGGDQKYLRDEQYGSGKNLSARFSLHEQFSLSKLRFRDFGASLIRWSDDCQVLECGTGTGMYWDNIHTPKSVSLTLTDLSPGMVAESTERARSLGYGSVEGQEVDVQRLPYEDDSFDVVVANHMLYHVPDPDLAVAEIARVLRPGGQAQLATNGHGHMDGMKDAVMAVFGEYSDGLYDVFGIDTGEARLRKQFESIAWHAYDNDLAVTDPQAVVDYGLSFPPGDSATPAQREQFAVEVEQRLVEGIFLIRTRTGLFVCAAPRPEGRL